MSDGRLGAILRLARGKESRVQFARRLGLSYTFVRAMECGQRFPSDPVLIKIAETLDLDPANLLLAAYSDRSPELTRVLQGIGVELPPPEPPAPLPTSADSAEALEAPPSSISRESPMDPRDQPYRDPPSSSSSPPPF